MADGSLGAINVDFANGVEVVHRAAFELVRPRDRNERVRLFRTCLLGVIAALQDIASLRFTFDLNLQSTPSEDEASVASWERSRTTFREGMELISNDRDGLLRMTRFVPDLQEPLQKAIEDALANTLDLRIGVALVLSDARELDELGYVPVPPNDATGPLIALDDVLREFA